MDEGDGYTLGLLLELRQVCEKIAGQHDDAGRDLHQLMLRLRNPNLHGLDYELSFRVMQKEPEYYGAPLRVVSASANLSLARVALEEAIRQDPKSGWVLLYPGGVAGRYDPPGTVVNDK